MNQYAKEVFNHRGGGQLLGSQVRDCHNAQSNARIDAMLESGEPNHYTITKRGQRKIIHQMPRLADGKVVGLIEISIPIPDELAHFDREG